MVIKSILWLPLCLSLSAQAATNFLESGIARFEQASRDWSFAAMTNAAAWLDQACQAAPQGAREHYWAGTAEFHVVLIAGRVAGDAARTQAQAALDRAARALERAIALNPEDGESHALLGTILGMRIAAAPLTAVWRGPGVMQHRRLALRYGTRNPRVHYLLGMGERRANDTAAGRAKARDCLRVAARLFAEERATPPSSGAPRWGYDHCLAALGEIDERQGQFEAAAACYRQSLAVNPQHALAREGLARCQASNHVTSP